MLKLTALSCCVGTKSIINAVSGTVNPGTITVCMGPNGSGKSSLVNVIAGHPAYQITAGSIEYNNKAIHELSPDKRAKAGVFLSPQYSPALPGVTFQTLLTESFNALHKHPAPDLLNQRIEKALELLHLEPSFLQKEVNVGFSGGQKKIAEILQLLVLQPKLVLLDEIDSGLDVDALKMVAGALHYFIKHNPESSLFIVTHYNSILQYINSESVWIMKAGKLVAVGKKELAEAVLKDGYEQF